MDAFVYCWTDHKTNKLYIGSHKGTPDDGYVCSSKTMMEEYRVRPEDFTRQIVAEGNFGDIRKLEARILESVDAKYNSDFYNQTNGDGNFYNKNHTKETRLKIGITKRQRNMRHSEEARRKMSEQGLGRIPWNKGKTGLQSSTRKGIHRTDEVKRKISETKRRKKEGITNGG